MCLPCSSFLTLRVRMRRVEWSANSYVGDVKESEDAALQIYFSPRHLAYCVVGWNFRSPDRTKMTGLESLPAALSPKARQSPTPPVFSSRYLRLQVVTKAPARNGRRHQPVIAPSLLLPPQLHAHSIVAPVVALQRARNPKPLVSLHFVPRFQTVIFVAHRERPHHHREAATTPFVDKSIRVRMRVATASPVISRHRGC